MRFPLCRRGQLPQVEEPERAAERVVARHLDADVAGAEDDAPHQQGGDGAQAHASRRPRQRQMKNDSVVCFILLKFSHRSKVIKFLHRKSC